MAKKPQDSLTKALSTQHGQWPKAPLSEPTPAAGQPVQWDRPSDVSGIGKSFRGVKKFVQKRADERP
jgi:hypothetical protein